MVGSAVVNTCIRIHEDDDRLPPGCRHRRRTAECPARFPGRPIGFALDGAYISPMTTFLALLLIAAMIATVVALVRGVVLFLKNASDDVKSGDGPSATSIRSNQMMMYRIIFQAVAILIAVLLLLLVGRQH